MALQTLRLLNFFDDPSLPEGLHGHAPWSAVLSPPLLFPVLGFNHRTPQVGRLVDRLRQVSMPAITKQWCNFSANSMARHTRLAHQLHYLLKIKQKIVYSIKWDSPMHAKKQGNTSLPHNPLHFWEVLIPLLHSIQVFLLFALPWKKLINTRHLFTITYKTHQTKC